ncbi:hypothetical protein CQW23_21809 [Capsicum baccatum]|uniref:Uncharacterized protein n=1 Tax=Capsicum baccatum TaxID=33114 RepID=A0A2G2VZ24_CAPBA|nr:hypothetical protein CQW23_21809 [Capsicum baccatum]
MDAPHWKKGSLSLDHLALMRVASATAANMCKKLPSDASDFVMEVVPLLMNLLQYKDAKVGDAGPILDVMAVMLENITSIQVVERTTIDVVYRASQIIASMPNLSYQNKHSRRLYFINYSLLWSTLIMKRALELTKSFLLSLFHLLFPLRRSSSLEKGNLKIEQKGNNSGILNRIKSTYSVGGSPASVEESANKPSSEVGPISLRLNNHQIILFLSSLWVQSISPENMPENYEAIAHTFSMVLLFSRAKGHMNMQNLQWILMDSEDRSWMNCLIWSDEFERGVKYFLEKAFE